MLRTPPAKAEARHAPWTPAPQATPRRSGRRRRTGKSGRPCSRKCSTKPLRPERPATPAYRYRRAICSAPSQSIQKGRKAAGKRVDSVMFAGLRRPRCGDGHGSTAWDARACRSAKRPPAPGGGQAMNAVLFAIVAYVLVQFAIGAWVSRRISQRQRLHPRRPPARHRAGRLLRFRHVLRRRGHRRLRRRGLRAWASRRARRSLRLRGSYHHRRPPVCQCALVARAHHVRGSLQATLLARASSAWS